MNALNPFFRDALKNAQTGCNYILVTTFVTLGNAVYVLNERQLPLLWNKAKTDTLTEHKYFLNVNTHTQQNPKTRPTFYKTDLPSSKAPALWFIPELAGPGGRRPHKATWSKLARGVVLGLGSVLATPPPTRPHLGGRRH